MPIKDVSVRKTVRMRPGARNMLALGLEYPRTTVKSLEVALFLPSMKPGWVTFSLQVSSFLQFPSKGKRKHVKFVKLVESARKPKGCAPFTHCRPFLPKAIIGPQRAITLRCWCCHHLEHHPRCLACRNMSFSDCKINYTSNNIARVFLYSFAAVFP